MQNLRLTPGLENSKTPQTIPRNPSTLVTQSRKLLNAASHPTFVSSSTKDALPSRRPDRPKNQHSSPRPGTERPVSQPSPEIGNVESTHPTDSSENHVDFAEPGINFDFNFHDGGLFDPEVYSIQSEPDTVEQAQSIAAALPHEIQLAINANEIDFYGPGAGDFYYVVVCAEDSDECVITEVAKSCNCYMSAEDNQLHHLSFDEFDENGFVELSISTEGSRLPAAIEYEIHLGDTIESIAESYGTEVDIVLAANPNLSNADEIDNGQAVNIPAQVHTVQAGETMYSLAIKYEVSLFALENLNNDLPNPNTIFTGQVLKVPIHDPTDGFAYTVKPGDTLLEIASDFGQKVESIMAANAHINSPDLIYPGQTIDIPISIPTRGQVSFEDVCDMCDIDEDLRPLTGAKIARAVRAPRVTRTTIDVGPTRAPIVADVPVSSRQRRGMMPSTRPRRIFRRA
ncbi:carbohydrate-binding module family 50 protein [Cadophora sp. DSE1049]|nr:carbohydrate-binding module family 50 protein [Cadophora sp. DSE1049]